MKITIPTILVIAVALIGGRALAQDIRAITPDGKTVILRPNGTWEYVDPAKRTDKTKSANANLAVKGKKLPYTLWIDESKWRVSDSPTNAAADLEFTHKTGDAYAMVIAERIPIPLARLQSIALSNAKKVAPDMKIVEEQHRTLNGTEMLFLRMEGTVESIPFVYQGYYYSNKRGTVQVVTYTGRSLFAEYTDDFDEFLEGFFAAPE